MFKKNLTKVVTGICAASMMLSSAITSFAAEDPSASTGVYIQIAGDDGNKSPDPNHYSSSAYDFIVPAKVLYAMKPDGSLISGWAQNMLDDTASASAMIMNNGASPIHVKTVTFEGDAGWNFTDSTKENYVEFSIDAKAPGTSAPTALVSTALVGGVDVSKDANFALSYKGIADGSDRVVISGTGESAAGGTVTGSSGKASRITKDLTEKQHLGTIKWTVTSKMS